VRRLLGLTCGLTLAATAFLGLSYALLKGLDDLTPLSRLAFVAGPSLLTLVALAWSRPPIALRFAAAAAGLALIWVGSSAIDRTLSGGHFEGYALVLGALAVAQGALTAFVFSAAVYLDASRFRRPHVSSD
jgi:hypothetical protein